MDVIGVALRAVSVARGANRLAGRPVQGLDDLHEALGPYRARYRIEQVRQAGQSSGSPATGDPSSDDSAGADGAGIDVDTSGADASGEADPEGGLGFLGAMGEWLRDQF
jgi:hypothetical protein